MCKKKGKSAIENVFLGDTFLSKKRQNLKT